MPLTGRIDQFKVMARAAREDLFDQSQPVGRLKSRRYLAAMLAGDTLVTISLAGSLFFNISPTAAESKVFFYLLFTLAPFAIVSPLLGPLIDRSRGARRAMVVASAGGRAILCPIMAANVHSLLLFPLAFLVLVCSKLYLVTRGALVPEVAAHHRPRRAGRAGHLRHPQRAADPAGHGGRLRHLGARHHHPQAGRGAQGVLIFDTLIFIGGRGGRAAPAVLRDPSTTAILRTHRRGGRGPECDNDRGPATPVRRPQPLT